MPQDGKLYVVATPIGHLADITHRALTTLQEVDLIAAEDTRHSRILLQHYHINTQLTSLHEHNEQDKLKQIINKLQSGQSVALISDAGTPLVSDPGFRLVLAAKEAGVDVVPVPGACALIAALSASGLPPSSFLFVGFLPHKGQVRVKKLKELGALAHTLIFYESPRRLLDLFENMKMLFGDERRVVLARELTKTYETIVLKPLGEMCDFVTRDENQQRGECVVLLEGTKEQSLDEQALTQAKVMLPILMAQVPLKTAVAMAVEITGCRKKPLYQHALEL